MNDDITSGGDNLTNIARQGLQAVRKPNIICRKLIAFIQPAAKELHNFRGLRELAMAQGIIRFHAGQIIDNDTKIRDFRILSVIADAWLIAGQSLRQTKRTVIFGNQQIVRLFRTAEPLHLRLEHANINIGRG